MDLAELILFAEVIGYYFGDFWWGRGDEKIWESSDWLIWNYDYTYDWYEIIVVLINPFSSRQRYIDKLYLKLNQ